jgi:hypothetical protein
VIRSYLSAAAVTLAAAADAAAQLNASTVGSGFDTPVFATSTPGSPNLYVVEKGGLVRTLDTATGAKGTFLDIRTGFNLLTDGERGLLGMAFAPGFANGNGRVYVDYTAAGTSSVSAVRVDEFTVTNGVVDAASRRNILSFDTPKANGDTANNHNAGWIGFSPTNGYLYVATGDSGAANDPLNVAQNTSTLQGKMLRVAVNTSASGPAYTVPADNLPVGGQPSVIYSYGLRNPYRNSFDRVTGELYIADVGQDRREEVNVVARNAAGGQNFGWRNREGTLGSPPPGGSVDPNFEYDHNTGNKSITGGYVYHGSAKDDAGQPLDGLYFFADYVSGRVFTIRNTGDPTTTAATLVDRTAELGLTPRANSIVSFGEDGLGDLYMVDINGTVYRIVPVPEPAAVGVVAAAALAAWRLRRRLPRPAAAHTVPG